MGWRDARQLGVWAALLEEQKIMVALNHIQGIQQPLLPSMDTRHTRGAQMYMHAYIYREEHLYT